MKKEFRCQRDKKVILKEKCKTNMVDMEKITHLTCESYLTTLHLIDNITITISKQLKHFEAELAEYGFIRVNHNTIINTKCILSILGGCKRMIILTNNSNVRISRRKMFYIKCLIENKTPLICEKQPLISEN